MQTALVTRWNLVRLLRLELAVAAALVVSVVLPMAWLDAAPVVCWIKRIYGVPCPGCGMTHAWVATGHGDFAAAFEANAFGAMLFVAAAVWLLLRMNPRGHAVLRAASSPRLRWPAWVLFGTWLAYSAVRAMTQLSA
ncbi:MAG: DUF2752 domain-containing protein [Planctomycetes bacterium]|nr:DUF2752 domain-containing protein [Planctomycetota bacterium]